MRSLLMVCAVVCLALVASVASAAPGQVPDATLAAYGLSGMQQMSDVQGTQVRGMGFAAVSGFSVAQAPGGQISANNYVAVSNPHHGSALAAGASVSVAASGVGVFTPWGNGGIVVGGVAGGGAVAYAK
jgi:hypothetical protein